MKNLVLFAVVLLIVSATISAVSAATFPAIEPSTYAWKFDNTETLKSFSTTSSDTSIELGSIKMDVYSSDPKITLDSLAITPIPASEYKYVAIRMRVNSQNSNYGCLFLPVTEESYSNSVSVSYGINAWQDIVIDLTTLDFWTDDKTLSYFRFDPIESDDNTAEIFIQHIGFFKTLDEANAFNATGTQYGESHFMGETHKAIVPDGVLSSGYDKSNYMLSNDTVLSGTSETNRPVVFYTDASGNKSIVSLCYTNPVGWTTYIANKPGTYTVAFNNKTFNDVSDHWAGESINFVTQREIFGGTSTNEFSPDMPITRGMFIAALGRMHGVDITEYTTNSFSDVPATEYYAPYIQWSKANGILQAVSSTTFAPEAPLTREQLAVAIYNYIDKYDYYFVSNTDAVSFTDIGSLRTSSKTSIKALQQSGIINGIGSNKFAPSGLSTRAEVAAVLERTVKGILNIPMYNFPYTKEEIQKDRIRLGAYGYNVGSTLEEQDRRMKQLSDLGLNYIVRAQTSANSTDRNRILDLSAKYCVESLVAYSGKVTLDGGGFNTSATVDSVNPLAYSHEYYEHPAFGGHEIADEPAMDSFDALSQITSEHSAVLPGKTPFVNLLPYYASEEQIKNGVNVSYSSKKELYQIYCDEFCENFNTNFICTDIYPLNWTTTSSWLGSTTTKKTTNDDYIESINLIATSARNHGKEFWSYIQAFSFDDTKRDPTEQEFRWQCYSMLSFGCKTIILYMYDGANKGLITDGYPNDNYNNAQPVMWEMRGLSDTYVQYENLGAFSLNQSDYSSKYLKFTDQLTPPSNFTITSSNPLLVGYFEKKTGTGYAFTVVNMVDFAKTTRTASFTFTISESGKTVTLHGKGTTTDYEARVLTPSNGKYSVNLEEGQGVFITVE
ncbi:MAG: S-layer homology domain-containing protein [Clostridia bacterium]|nr:S-layer homology domain-containing protein [Clostridia bacterium]